VCARACAPYTSISMAVGDAQALPDVLQRATTFFRSIFSSFCGMANNVASDVGALSRVAAVPVEEDLEGEESRHALIGREGATQKARMGKATPPPPLSRRLRWVGWVLLVVVLLLLARSIAASRWWRRTVIASQKASLRYSKEHPVSFAVASGTAICVWVILSIPSTPIELLLAFAYGLGPGFLIVYIGKLVGCIGSFAFGRSACTGYVAKLLQEHEILRAVAKAITTQPWKTCILARAAYLPIGLKNYGFAALDVPLLPFMVTLIGVEAFNTFQMIYLGVAMRDIGGSLTAKKAATSESWQSTCQTAIAAASLVLLAIYCGRATKQALEELRAEEAIRTADDLEKAGVFSPEIDAAAPPAVGACDCSEATPYDEADKGAETEALKAKILQS